MKTYSKLILLPTFEERFAYLQLSGDVGVATFGGERMLNQIFYNTPEWKSIRREVIIRDEGCDLAFPDRPIQSKILIHHLNPLSKEDILERRPCLFDLENLVCVSYSTHQAIHYGDSRLIVPTKPNERKPNDQCPWRKEG